MRWNRAVPGTRRADHRQGHPRRVLRSLREGGHPAALRVHGGSVPRPWVGVRGHVLLVGLPTDAGRGRGVRVAESPRSPVRPTTPRRVCCAAS
ncbi:hypothetical protein QJS66_02605 [Kocuria rhizophila]|nr:hypothetical protein QJS66_02605 [Kocuria rhizophila]